MKNKFGIFGVLFGTLLLFGTIISSCSKDDDNKDDGKTDPSTIATASLVAYFPFEDDGVDEIDDLTPVESPNVTFVSGRRGKAYQGANNAYMLYDLPEAHSLRDLPAFTVSMWFYGTPAVDGVPPVPAILQISGSADPNWGNFCFTQDRMPETVDSLALKLLFRKDGVLWAPQFIGVPNKKFIENMWFHLVFTYDNASSKFMIYVNGDPLDLNEGITDRWAAGDDVVPRPKLGDLVFDDGADQFAIGGWIQKINEVSTDEWMGYFTGMIDELRIYDKGLTGTEVNALFEAEVSQLNK